MANKEVYIGPMEWMKPINKLTMAGWLGAAGVSAVVAPPLVLPFLGLAAVDYGQNKIIDHVNTKH